MGTGFTDAATLQYFLTPEQTSAKECAGTQHHRRRKKRFPVSKDHALHASASQLQRGNFTFNLIKAILRSQHRLNRGKEQSTIRLDTRAVNRATLRTVEHPVMNCRCVSCTSDQTIERIHFTN